MKKFLGLCVGTMAVVASVSVSAEELWDPHLRGVNEGLVAGALPPPGVYGVLDNYWMSYAWHDNKGNQTNLKLDALVEIPIVLWSTGYKVLGADYAMALAQPFTYTDLKQANNAGLSNNAHWGNFNTILVPGQLSWALPNDFHVKGSLSVYLDDASSSTGRDAPSGGGAGSGNPYYTLEPGVALTWLHDGWNLGVDLTYAYNFTNSSTNYSASGQKLNYTSGSEIAIDYTATKTIGKWTFGIGAHQENQLSNDSGSGAAKCAATNGCKVTNYGIGPLVGYQFEDINVLFEYNHNIYTENDFAGDLFNIRLMKAF
jgi:hypothetical protein